VFIKLIFYQFNLLVFFGVILSYSFPQIKSLNTASS